MPSSTLTAWVLLLTAVTASLLPPKQDPWYSAPTGFETTTPGTILRMRTAPGNITTAYQNCSAAYNILFRTTDSSFQPTFAVTTVLLPAHGAQSLLSYQIPYNTADLNASPSFRLNKDARMYTDIPSALGQGWIVSVPDFEGPRASFLMGLSEGRAVLDSILAVRSHENVTKAALWGYSGGSIASMFALELHAQYAPHLQLDGAAIGGTVPNFAATASIINAGPQAGLLPAALLGLTSQSASARTLLKSSLAGNATKFMAAENYTLGAAIVAFNGTDITSFFSNYSSFIFNPEIQALQRDNWHLGYHGTPQVPIFMYKAIQDELAPIEQVDDLVQRWCLLGGVDIRYERNRHGGHASEYENGAARAQQFLASVFSGSKQHRGCTTVDVTAGVDSAPQ